MNGPIVLPLDGVAPRIGDDVFLAPGCVIVGDVEIGPGASVWFNAVVRGDVAPIRIGARSNVQDNAVLHVDSGSPCVIGHDVTIGHGAIVHAATVGDGVTIGMGAIVLSRSRIGDSSIVAAGALVPEDAIVADSVLVMGIPAHETRRLDLDGRQRSLDNAARYVANGVRYRRQTWAIESGENGMAVDVSRADAVATVTLNRPRALNAFDTAQLRRLLDVFETIAADRSIRAVVITGAGEKSFAAGADIKEMAELSPDAAMVFGRLGHAAMQAAAQLPQPVIAAVNGYAFGGGCELALACDIRLASPNAVFAQPEVSLGIPPGWGGSQRLPRIVGPGLAAEMIFTGRRVGADEGLRIGLVNAIHPLGRLLPEATGMAAGIAANSPAAVRAAKRLLALAFGRDQAIGLETERMVFAAAFDAPDQREGMRAFIEKRAATFAD